MDTQILIQDSPASFLLMILICLVSLIAMFKSPKLYESWLLQPYRVVYGKKWYLIITSSFLHADLTHLLFNMLTFYFFAFNLESITGTVDFLIIYFVSMILSDISTVIKNKDNHGYRAVGASGAISGVVFSSILFNPGAKMGIIFFPVPIPAPIFGLLYLAYCYYAARSSSDDINHEAHFYGALSGIIITIILFPAVVKYFINYIF
jgi:membrane associated rhomboid family serine protease